MKRTSESGFSLVESLLIVVVICLVGFVAFYVFNSKQNVDLTTQSASTPSSLKTSNSAYLALPSAGVKIPVYSTIKDVDTLPTQDGSKDSVSLTTKSFEAAVTQCMPKNQAIGIVPLII